MLAQIGYTPKDILLQRKLDFELGIIKTKLIKDGTKDWYVESLLSLVNTISGEEEWNWAESKMATNEAFEEAYETIRRIALDLPFRLSDNDEVFIALCSFGRDDRDNLFKFMRASHVNFGDFKFIWGSHENRESLISAQNFFAANFEIQYQIFLTPSVLNKNQAKKNSARFRDVLDYNGYSLFMEDVSNIDRVKFEKVFNHFSSSKINYLLGE